MQVVVETSPFSSALVGLLRSSGSSTAALSPREPADVAEYTTQMLRRIVARSDENYFGRRGDTRLTKVLAWIEKNLAVSGLGPEKVAAVHHISLRRLHGCSPTRSPRASTL
ncbi:hypothetical protein [Streptomyces sp. T028]|uniref:hypothetical protein n=1 Tax=Streptomyces sp. T028 TaxID=3394379 RepID=UPI003A85112C